MSTPKKGTTKLPRIGALFSTLALTSILAATACDGGGEGQRCNPSLSHDECGGGLVCTQPAFCSENYCCSANGASQNSNCQPGCGGGAAAMCTAAADAGAPACAFATCIADASLAACLALASPDGAPASDSAADGD